MKTIIAILTFSLFLGCNNSTKEEETVSTSEISNKPETTSETESITSGDYTTLLVNYNCNMTASELAKVLKVPETDVEISEYGIENKCVFFLKGFGSNAIDEPTILSWSTQKNSKSQNLKEIKNYKKNQVELPENVRLGMRIDLADTKDCYIAQQPAHGRVIIYNENYDTAFLLNYGRSGAFKRTKEQHQTLNTKMNDLANYLLKKHRQ